MPRKAPNIYHRNDGRWEGRFIKGHDSNGKALYGAVYAKTYTEVKAKLEEARATLELGKPPVVKQSLVEILRGYIESSRLVIKTTTISLYERYLNSYIEPYFGNLCFAKVTAEKMQGFVNSLIERGLATHTISAVISFIKVGVKSQAFDNIFNIKVPKKPRSEMAVLSIDEQKRLETAAKSSDDINRVAIFTCLYTGIRIGELCGLKWFDVDLSNKNIRITCTLQRVKADGKTKVIELTPKSESSERTIPIPKFLVEILLEQQKKHGETYVISFDKKPVEPRTLQLRYKKLLKEAGLEDINFHALRHTFATRALENGMDVKTLSELLGHSNASVTLNRYAHSLDEHKRDEMERLADSLSDE